MKQNPVLKETILQVVENQLRDDDPPETRITFNRLISKSPERRSNLASTYLPIDFFTFCLRKTLFSLLGIY
jgi:hypothetical protein